MIMNSYNTLNIKTLILVGKTQKYSYLPNITATTWKLYVKIGNFRFMTPHKMYVKTNYDSFYNDEVVCMNDYFGCCQSVGMS